MLSVGHEHLQSSSREIESQAFSLCSGINFRWSTFLVPTSLHVVHLVKSQRHMLATTATTTGVWFELHFHQTPSKLFPLLTTGALLNLRFRNYGRCGSAELRTSGTAASQPGLGVYFI